MMSRVARLALIFVLLWALPALAQSPAWIAALQQGGHVIVLRHGATYPDQADTNPLDPKDTAHQRQLNDSGRARQVDGRGAAQAQDPGGQGPDQPLPARRRHRNAAGL